MCATGLGHAHGAATSPNATGCNGAALAATEVDTPPECDESWTAGCRYQLRPGSWVRSETTDASVAVSVVSDYMGLLHSIGRVARIRAVLDAGANVGHASALFAAFWPAALVVSLEPQRGNYAMLRLNTAHFRNVLPLRAALDNATARMAVARGTRRHTGKEWQYMTRPATGLTHESVPSFHASALLRGLCLPAFDFVKVDVEGAEKAVFESRHDESWLRGARYVYVETHEDMASGSYYAAVRGLQAARLSVLSVRVAHETLLFACRDTVDHCMQVCTAWSDYTARMPTPWSKTLTCSQSLWWGGRAALAREQQPQEELPREHRGEHHVHEHQP